MIIKVHRTCLDYSTVKQSKYKYVRIYNTKSNSNNKSIGFDIVYSARICVSTFTWHALFDSEREAAIAVDKKLIEKGKKPVNILKSKIVCNLF